MKVRFLCMIALALSAVACTDADSLSKKGVFQNVPSTDAYPGHIVKNA